MQLRNWNPVSFIKGLFTRSNPLPEDTFRHHEDPSASVCRHTHCHVKKPAGFKRRQKAARKSARLARRIERRNRK